jgi:hypothetical protein
MLLCSVFFHPLASWEFPISDNNSKPWQSLILDKDTAAGAFPPSLGTQAAPSR